MGNFNCYCYKKPEDKEEIQAQENISLPANFLEMNNFNSNLSDRQTINSTLDNSKTANNKKKLIDIYEEDELDFTEDNTQSMKVLPKRPLCKQLVNMNVPTKPPLEVINESNVESANESFRHNRLSIKETGKTSILGSSNQIPVTNDNRSRLHVPLLKSEAKSETNSKALEGISRRYEVSLIKKEPNKEDINEKWAKMLIINIIPDSKLFSEDDEEIMYNGYLEKVTLGAGKIPKIITVSKFCIVTKIQMKSFKSKESYLTHQRPTQTININSILLIRRIVLNKDTKSKFYFYIKTKENNPCANSDTLRESTERENDIEKFINETTKRESLFSQVPKNSPDKSRRNTKRISLLNDSNVSEMVESAREKISHSIMEQYDLMSKDMLIFSTDSEELANHWVCVLNYFVNDRQY